MAQNRTPRARRNDLSNLRPGADAPATETPAMPDATEQQDAPATETPDATDAPAQQEPEQDAPDAEPEQVPAPETSEPPAEPQEPQAPATPQEPQVPPEQAMLAHSTSADPMVAQDDREAAFANAAGLMLRNALASVAALPDDQPVYADRLDFRLSGASGRGPAASRSTLRIAQALFGAGWYEGDCHGRTKGRKIDVRVVVPRLFAPAFVALAEALNHEHGPLVRPELAAYAAGRERIKNSGIREGETEYGLVNKRGRIAMEAASVRIADAIQAQFPDDDPAVVYIRRVLAAVRSEMERSSPVKNVTSTVDRFTPVPALATVTAGDPQVASA